MESQRGNSQSPAGNGGGYRSFTPPSSSSISQASRGGGAYSRPNASPARKQQWQLLESDRAEFEFDGSAWQQFVFGRGQLRTRSILAASTVGYATADCAGRPLADTAGIHAE